ncbi:MAG: PEP-CTERM sorting domain-containing protein [Verrucomicrobia bacterium]|nr:PEP-CTERM sorting domain-containing protein [Verrucomicrobiota bacterium]
MTNFSLLPRLDTMKTFAALVALGLSSACVMALPDYEPFADATGSGGTAYTVGSTLIGQKGASGYTWMNAQTAYTGSITPTITAGNLSISGLAPAQGNSVQLGGIGNVARLGFTPAGSPYGSGATVYYSFAMQLRDLTGINTSTGAWWAGFNNSLGTQAAAPTQVGTRVITKAATGGFNLGTSKNSSVASDFAFSPTLFTTSDTIFVVGSYTCNTGSTTDDVSRMWINPDSSTFGAVIEPTASLTASTGADINLSQLASFILADRSGTPGAVVDELRIGLSWAAVTPMVPEPSSLALVGLGLAALLARRVARKQ